MNFIKNKGTLLLTIIALFTASCAKEEAPKHPLHVQLGAYTGQRVQLFIDNQEVYDDTLDYRYPEIPPLLHFEQEEGSFTVKAIVNGNVTVQERFNITEELWVVLYYDLFNQQELTLTSNTEGHIIVN